eukprot:768628-Hanusia_phi.AAC.14
MGCRSPPVEASRCIASDRTRRSGSETSWYRTLYQLHLNVFLCGKFATVKGGHDRVGGRGKCMGLAGDEMFVMRNKTKMIQAFQQ